MRTTLEQIFELESTYQFDDAFLNYKLILNQEIANFDIWKYYYFFLWSMLEDLEGDFKILKYEEVKQELNKEFVYGLEKFDKIAEFNFIVGYTISIFPYEFGDYEEFEHLGTQLLKKAINLDRENELYQMVFLGGMINRSASENNLYEKLKLNVAESISKNYSGKGLLNKYYNQVFKR